MVKFDIKDMNDLRTVKLATVRPEFAEFMKLVRSNLDAMRSKYERERDEVELRNLQGAVIVLSDLTHIVENVDGLMLDYETRARNVAKKVKASQAINT